MPRNGTGSYSLPSSSWNPAVDGTTIDSSDWNTNVADDLEGALTQSVSKDGQTVWSGNMNAGNNKITNLASGTVTTDAANYGQVVTAISGTPVWATVGGTANAVTLTVTPAITAYAAGQVFRYTATATNTSAITYAVSGLATKAGQSATNALVGGETVIGQTYEIVYDGTAFQIGAMYVGQLMAVDAGATAGPTTDLYRNSASPAASDLIGTVTYTGKDSGGNKTLYAEVAAQINDATDTTEDGQLNFNTMQAGTKTTAMKVAVGAQVGAPTGGDQGAGTLNAVGLYVGGVAVSTSFPVAVRQTALSGTVDANGLPNFGGSTGSGTVTQSTVLIVTAANGFAINGQVDRVGSITNASWTGLTTNGTMYLYLDIAASGVCTPGSTTVLPVYQWGGTYSTTNNQFTFNIQEMIGKVGNGATAAQTYRVFVGEVTVAGNVVTAIVWYQLMGRYLGPLTSTLPALNSNTQVSHNIGTNLINKIPMIILQCLTIDASYSVGDRIANPMSSDGSGKPFTISYTRLAISFSTGATNYQLTPQGGGAAAALTLARWAYQFQIDRGW